jgi:hypothetical protein
MTISSCSRAASTSSPSGAHRRREGARRGALHDAAIRGGRALGVVALAAWGLLGCSPANEDEPGADARPVPITSADGARGLAASDGELYWVDASGQLILAIRGDGSERRVVIDGLDEASSLRVVGDDLYWLNFRWLGDTSAESPAGSSDGSIQLMTAPRAGGPATKLFEGAGASSGGLAVGDDGAYLAMVTDPADVSATSGALIKVPRTGAPVTLAGALAFPTSVTVDGDFVYWVNRGQYQHNENGAFSGDTAGGSVVRVARAGGPPETLAAGLANARALAVDDERIYFIAETALAPDEDRSNSALWSCPKSGCGEANALATKLVEGVNLRDPRRDGHMLYFLEGAGGGSSVLSKVPVGGGERSSVFATSDRDAIGSFAIEGDFAYLVHQKNVYNINTDLDWVVRAPKL